MSDPVAEAYADCIHIRCRSCGAPPIAYCLNPITGQDRAAPCWTRIHDSERPPSARAQQAINRDQENQQ